MGGRDWAFSVKIAVLSDIDGNFPALESVAEDVGRWQPVVTVVNGDIVNRGPFSRRCWTFVHERPWHAVGGNHEAYVALWDGPSRPWEGCHVKLHRPCLWTYRELGGSATTLADLPSSLSLFVPDGSEVRVTHGSMHGNRDGIYRETPDVEMRQKIAPAPAVFYTTHTHRPFDGKWGARLVRLRYDRLQTARDFWASGFLEEGGPLVHVFYREWRDARPLVTRWSCRYEAAVLEREIGLEASVSVFLAAARARKLAPCA